MDQQQENDKFSKIDLFSTEGQRYLGEVVSVVDIRNFARLDFGSLPSDPAALADPSQSQSGRYGCNICKYRCNTVNEQRDHFQSEWHLFNLRCRLKSKPTINEDVFEQILASEDSQEKNESSSGSDTSSEESDDQEEQYSKLDVTNFGTRGGAVFFLTKDNRVVSCYRSLLTSLRSYQVENDILLANVRHLHAEKNVWIILTLSGGHFAGAVFENGNCKNNEAVVHKTIHRYTVRAKQGGSQVAKDAQGGMCKSGGATLRRYNEEALVKDIRNLVTNWNEYVRRASAIFLRCSMYHRHIFYAGPQPLFAKTDQRVRNIPFMTRKPTYEEAKRIRSELATMDVFESYESFLSQYRQDEKMAGNLNLEQTIEEASKLKLKQEKKSEKKRKEKEKEKEKKKKNSSPTSEIDDAIVDKKISFDLSQDLRQRLYTACKRGDVTTIQEMLDERPEETKSIRDYLNSPIINDKEASTFLHSASASGHSDLLRFLLEFGCDPTKKNAQSRVPFQMSNSKSTRNVFTEFRENFPERCDWKSAQIPEPTILDPELEASRKAKMAERKKAAAKAKAEKTKEKREADKKARDEEAEKRRYLKLSDREKRALAAERRWQTQMKDEVAEKKEETENLVLARCFRCGIDITGKVPFEYSENRFCSTKCVKEHRFQSSN